MTRMFRLKDEAAYMEMMAERGARFQRGAQVVDTNCRRQARGELCACYLSAGAVCPFATSTSGGASAQVPFPHPGHHQRGARNGDAAGVAPGPLTPLVNLCRLAGLPVPVTEFRFHPTRKWRADYAFVNTEPKVLVEIDGGAWTQGRHTRGAGFIEDQRKLNAATLLGFTVLRYTPDRLGECINDLRILFAKEAA